VPPPRRACSGSRGPLVRECREDQKAKTRERRAGAPGQPRHLHRPPDRRGEIVRHAARSAGGSASAAAGGRSGGTAQVHAAVQAQVTGCRDRDADPLRSAIRYAENRGPERNAHAADWAKAAQDLAGKCDALEGSSTTPRPGSSTMSWPRGVSTPALSPLLSFVHGRHRRPDPRIARGVPARSKELDGLETDGRPSWRRSRALGRKARELNLDASSCPDRSDGPLRMEWELDAHDA